MKQSKSNAGLGWSRREFLATGSLTVLASQAKMSGAWPRPEERFAYVSTMGTESAIHVYAIRNGDWSLRETLAAQAPVSLALHPNGRILYALHAVETHAMLPCGFVTSYKINTEQGKLHAVRETPLALSATDPRHMAVSPDGTQLVVAVHGGGSYNVLAIADDGLGSRVIGIVKETGSGPVSGHQDASHPQTVLFDTTGLRVIGADLGCDRLRVLSLADEIQSHDAYSVETGSGPGHLAMHPNGQFLYVANRLSGGVQGIRYDALGGRLMEEFARVDCEPLNTMAIHRKGQVLYGASSKGLNAWRIDEATGALRLVQRDEYSGITALYISPTHEHEMLALSPEGVLHISLNKDSQFGEPTWKASLDGAKSVVIHDVTTKTGNV